MELPRERKVTLWFCQTEFLSLTTLIVAASVAISAFTLSVFFFEVNAIRLPYNFYIVFLPFDKVSTNWLLNYLQQAVFEFVSTPVLFTYFPLTLLLMNHTCWGFDNLILLAESVSDEMKSAEGADSVNEGLEAIIKKSYTVINWRNEVQDLLKFNFFMEFSSLSFILCLLLFTLTVDPSATFLVYFFTPPIVVQLFAYCLMGKLVDDRIVEYANVIYDIPWYEMNSRQQKDIKFILAMAQSIKGFNGIFNDVGMKAFLKVRRTFSVQLSF